MNQAGLIIRFKLLSNKVRNSRLFKNRWLNLGIQTLVVTLCFIYLAVNLRNIQDAKLDLQIDLIVQAGGITIAAVFLGSIGWWLTLRALGQSVGKTDAIRAHIYANLAKYVPGYAWQLFGKAYLTRSSGVPVKIIAVGMTLELVQLVLGGLFVASIALPTALVQNYLGEYFWLGWLWIARLFILFVLIVMPFVASRLSYKKRGWAEEVRIDPWLLLAATLSMLLSWCIFGLSYWMLGAAVKPLTFELVGIFTFTLVTSFLLGLAVVIVPASIGVRESIMVVLLESVVGSPVAVIIAGLSRLVLTISELLSALIIWLVNHFRH